MILLILYCVYSCCVDTKKGRCILSQEPCTTADSTVVLYTGDGIGVRRTYDRCMDSAVFSS